MIMIMDHLKVIPFPFSELIPQLVDDGYIPTSESSDSDTETPPPHRRTLPPSAHQLSESVLSENDEVPNVMLTSEPNKNAADIPDPSNDTSQFISSKPLLKRLSPQPKRRRTKLFF